MPSSIGEEVIQLGSEEYVALCKLCKFQACTNVGDDFLWGSTDVLDDCGNRLFQSGELAGYKILSHKMVGALREVAVELFSSSTEIDECYLQIGRENIAIRLAQGRTCEDDIFATIAAAQRFFVDSLEPGEAVFVGQRNPDVHFLAIGGGMKIVSVEKGPSTFFGQQPAHGGFAGASHAHDQNDHEKLWHRSGIWSATALPR